MGLGGGPYNVTPSKTGDVNGISSLDASRVAQHVAKLITLTSNQQLAGDASNNGSLSSFDASLIAQTVAGLPNAGIAGIWKFVPSSRTYLSLSGDETDQNFNAILVGDVTGNWSASDASVKGIAPNGMYSDSAAQVTVSLPNTAGASGLSVTIPITVGDLTGFGVVAYDFTLAFDPNVLQLQSPPTDSGGTLSSGMTITPNASSPGRLIISAFGSNVLSGAGTLLNLKFNVVGAPGTSTPLTWQMFTFNEGMPSASVANGSFTVNNPTSSFQFSAANYSASESVGSAIITVTRSGDTSSTSSVDYQSSDSFSFIECNVKNGLADQRCDYITTVGTLTFAANETSKTFTIPIINDFQVEGDETLNLSLSNPAGGTLGTQNTAVLTISDNDTIQPATRLFLAQLDGSHEIPQNNSTATGLGTLLLGVDETTAQVNLSFTGLSSTQTGAHIHGPAAITLAAPIIFPLPNGTVTNETINLNSDQVRQLKQGLFYFNVHTTNFQSGEIRGQILANPIEEARFFVRQQYYNFLSREPDPGGLGYWTYQVTGNNNNEPPPCPAEDPSCINQRHVNVAGAFFYEQEYQLTGAYVYRLYRAAYGNSQPKPNLESTTLPSYAVFVQDRARVVAGGDLAQNQLALANAFVGRSEFLTKYPASLTGQQFVDGVLATIRNDIGAELVSQRDVLIGHFSTGGRGLVMFHLANDYWNNCHRLQGSPPAPCVPVNFGTAVDNRPFIDAEYNSSFVLTEYFGFLRRDPDFGGFLFWRDIVDRKPIRDPSGQHQMVCAFITSPEYQRRFNIYFTRSDRECAGVQ